MTVTSVPGSVLRYSGNVLIEPSCHWLGSALLMTGLWKVHREPFWLEMAILLSKRELSELSRWCGSTYGAVGGLCCLRNLA